MLIRNLLNGVFPKSVKVYVIPNESGAGEESHTSDLLRKQEIPHPKDGIRNDNCVTFYYSSTFCLIGAYNNLFGKQKNFLGCKKLIEHILSLKFRSLS